MYSGADEQRFLEASMAYVSGNPIMSDEEFDNLKQKLKVLDACYFLLSFCYCLIWHYYLVLTLVFTRPSTPFVDFTCIPSCRAMEVKLWSRDLDAVYEVKRFAFSSFLHIRSRTKEE